jgi:hypothetical protein
MSKSDLRSSLHALIDGIEDATVLQAYLILLSREVKSREDFWETIDGDTKIAIEEGITNFATGKDHDFFEYMKTAHGVER